MKAKEQYKKYKEILKQNIEDFAHKGWSPISFVIYQYNTRNSGIVDAGYDDFHWEEWA